MIYLIKNIIGGRGDKAKEQLKHLKTDNVSPDYGNEQSSQTSYMNC